MQLLRSSRMSNMLIQITWIISVITFLNASTSLYQGYIVSYSMGSRRRCWRSRRAVVYPTRGSSKKRGGAYGLGPWRSKQLPDWCLFAILAWRVAANFGVFQGWRTQALQALVLVIGIYTIQAAVVVDPSNRRRPRNIAKEGVLLMQHMPFGYLNLKSTHYLLEIDQFLNQFRQIYLD